MESDQQKQAAEKSAIRINLDDIDAHEVKKPAQKRWAVILLVAASVFVLAGGAGGWLLWQKFGSKIKLPGLPVDDTSSITNVSFVAPKDLPAAYALREQDMSNSQHTFYADGNTNCVITTDVSPASDIDAQKIAEDALAKQTLGVTTTSTGSSADVSIGDNDNVDKSYSFKAVSREQEVDLPGVGYNQQTEIMAFKRFNKQVATIAYSCRADQWETKNAELETLVKEFKLKVEKQQ